MPPGPARPDTAAATATGPLTLIPDGRIASRPWLLVLLHSAVLP